MQIARTVAKDGRQAESVWPILCDASDIAGDV